MEGARAGPPAGGEVRAVAAFPRPVDVLRQRALVALHDVVVGRADRPCHRERQPERPRHGGRAHDREAVAHDPRQRQLPRRAVEVHVVAVRDEGADEPGRGRLHAAVVDERARDERELHGRPEAATRSTSGKSRARAAVKL